VQSERSSIDGHCEYQKRVKRLQAEIDRVTAGDPLALGIISTFTPYVRSFYREVMRWRPAFPLGVAHYVEEDDVYEGLSTSLKASVDCSSEFSFFSISTFQSRRDNYKYIWWGWIEGEWLTYIGYIRMIPLRAMHTTKRGNGSSLVKPDGLTPPKRKLEWRWPGVLWHWIRQRTQQHTLLLLLFMMRKTRGFCIGRHAAESRVSGQPCLVLARVDFNLAKDINGNNILIDGKYSDAYIR